MLIVDPAGLEMEPAGLEMKPGSGQHPTPAHPRALRDLFSVGTVRMAESKLVYFTFV